ncbi:hypothetical protein T06_16798 [Trichinella sp. T6]|nr:hypothetical protein T06_16798 [Trichinella sp. T6]
MLSSCMKGNTHTHIILHFSIIPQFEPKFPIIGQNRILDFINNEKSPSTTLDHYNNAIVKFYNGVLLIG